MNTTTFYRK